MFSDNQLDQANTTLVEFCCGGGPVATDLFRSRMKKIKEYAGRHKAKKQTEHAYILQCIASGVHPRTMFSS